MKLTKTSSALATAALLAFTSTTYAQPTNHPPVGGRPPGGIRGVESQITALNEQLKLTDEQKPKVKAILEEQNKKITEIRGDSALAQEDRRTKMQNLREETAKKMKEVLSAEQFKKYEEFQQQQRNRRPGGPNSPAAGGAGTPTEPKPNH